jgi:hypothetical protein
MSQIGSSSKDTHTIASGGSAEIELAAGSVAGHRAVSDLVFRQPRVVRRSRQWQDKDFDVFDGEHEVGRVYLVDRDGRGERWFWGVSFRLTGRKSYGHTHSLDAAKAAFKSEYEDWKQANSFWRSMHAPRPAPIGRKPIKP